MKAQHRRQASAETFTDLPLRNGQLIPTYYRDAVERRSRENLNGLDTEEFDERIMDLNFQPPKRGILKNKTDSSCSPGTTPSTSTPQYSLPNRAIEERQQFIPRSYPQPQATTNPYVQQYVQEVSRLPVKTAPNFEYEKNPPYNQPIIYRPTTESVASMSTKTHKTYDKLAEVYSNSGDTVQFASNMRTFLDDRIPGFVWVFLLCLQVLVGLLSIFIGTFNYPFCNAQPNIPIYLIVSGILLITNGSVRLFAHIPAPRNSTRSQNTLVSDLCFYGLEGLIIFGIVVIVVLGCVWVYGSSWNIHFHHGMFEEHYCDWFLFWFSWWSVTLHLVIGALVALATLVILMYGSVAL